MWATFIECQLIALLRAHESCNNILLSGHQSEILASYLLTSLRLLFPVNYLHLRFFSCWRNRKTHQASCVLPYFSSLLFLMLPVLCYFFSSLESLSDSRGDGWMGRIIKKIYDLITRRDERGEQTDRIDQKNGCEGTTRWSWRRCVWWIFSKTRERPSAPVRLWFSPPLLIIGCRSNKMQLEQDAM